jgi:large repetitive protein
MVREIILLRQKFRVGDVMRSNAFGPTLRLTVFLGASVALASSAMAGPSYTYDALGRVVAVTYANGKQVVYSYDAAGNRTQEVISATTVNRAPVAVADAVTINEDATSATFNPRTNDTDADGHSLTLYSVKGGDLGTSALSGSGTTVTYTTSSKRNGTDKLFYVITDGNGMDATGEVNITLANLPPVVVTDAISTQRNVATTFDPRSNDSDPGNDAFTVTAKSTPSHGTVTIGTGGVSLTYTPTASYYGTDSFTYTVTDVDGGATTGTVNATIYYGTATPVANNDNSGVMGGQTRTFDPRLNDTDADSGDTRTITAKTNGAHGTVTINSGTSVSYAAATGWTGNDTFTYTIADLDNRTATGTVTMSVSATNRAPTAEADLITIYGTYTPPPYKPSAQIDPRWNDTDPDGHALSVTGQTNGTYGNVTRSGNTLTWTKKTNIGGTTSLTDTFTYTLSDGHGGTSTGTVTVDLQIETNE